MAVTDFSDEDRALPYSNEWAKFVHDYWNKKRESTAVKRKKDVRRFLRWFTEQPVDDLNEITKQDLDGYIGFLKNTEGLADETVSGYWNGASSFLEFLTTDLRVLEQDPSEDVTLGDFTTIDLDTTKKESEMRLDEDEIYYLTPEEVELLIEHSRPVQGPTLRNKLLLRLIWQTGMRRGEVVNVKMDDIDREERSIFIDAQKSKDRRTVWYQGNLARLLNQWTDGGVRSASPHAEDSEYLFVTQKSNQMWPGTIGRIVNDSAEEAHIQETVYNDHAGSERKKITAHVIRHSYAVYCVKNGMDIARLKDLLGHKSIETTKKYLKFSNEDKRQAAKKYGPR